MRAPKRRRPLLRAKADAAGRDLAALSQQVRYLGSAEHKSYLSPAGTPRLRSDATPCPKDLATFDQLTEWLAGAVAAGDIGAPWEGDYPRYAWVRNEHGCFEARLTNRGQGTYKGYPLSDDEIPDWMCRQWR